MAKPVWIQIRITIRKKLFQNGTAIQACGCAAEPGDDRVEDADLL